MLCQSVDKATRALYEMFSVSAGEKAETEEQQKLENESMKQSMEQESPMRVYESAMQESHASVSRRHEHEEEARAPLMRVASEA